jgi:hypothetical protein
MRFPNLIWALDERHEPHYAFCRRIAMGPSRFSRCLNGQFEFSPTEEQGIATALELPVDWLFAQPMPPSRKDIAHRRRAGAKTRNASVSYDR